MATVIDVESAGGALADIFDRAMAGEEIILVREGGPQVTLRHLTEQERLEVEREMSEAAARLPASCSSPRT